MNEVSGRLAVREKEAGWVRVIGLLVRLEGWFGEKVGNKVQV